MQEIEKTAVNSATRAGARHSSEMEPRNAVERVFCHWVWMLGHNPRRVALGSKRRRAIERMLELYEEDVLLCAIEGCAASPFHRGENDRDTEYTDLALILRDEDHVERFARAGERVRARAALMAQRAAEQAAQPQVPAPSAEQAALQRQRLREVADRMAGRKRG